MTRSRLLLAVGAALTALYGAALLYETTAAPAGCCGLTWPQPDPSQAERLVLAKDPKGLDAGLQRRAAVDILRARPADSNAWLRLAYADQLGAGRLSEQGRKALETSYLVLPFAGPDAAWRIGFVLDHWSQLTRQAREDALNEIKVAREDGRVWPGVKAAAARARDPSGRMAAVLLGLY